MTYKDVDLEIACMLHKVEGIAIKDADSVQITMTITINTTMMTMTINAMIISSTIVTMTILMMMVDTTMNIIMMDEIMDITPG